MIGRWARRQAGRQTETDRQTDWKGDNYNNTLTSVMFTVGLGVREAERGMKRGG